MLLNINSNSSVCLEHCGKQESSLHFKKIRIPRLIFIHHAGTFPWTVSLLPFHVLLDCESCKDSETERKGDTDRGHKKIATVTNNPANRTGSSAMLRLARLIEKDVLCAIRRLYQVQVPFLWYQIRTKFVEGHDILPEIHILCVLLSAYLVSSFFQTSNMRTPQLLNILRRGCFAFFQLPFGATKRNFCEVEETMHQNSEEGLLATTGSMTLKNYR